MFKKEHLKKYAKSGGYTGIANLGNTCFLNSCIQILNHTYELVEIMRDEKTKRVRKDTVVDSIILREWVDLQDIMFKNTGVITPNKFVYFVQKVAKEKNRELFTGWAQNDMSEFLLFIIECFHNSISRSVKMKIHGEKKNDVDVLAVECYDMLRTTFLKEYSEIMNLFYGIYLTQIISMDGKTTHVNKPEQYFILDLPIPLTKEKNLLDCFQLFTQKEAMQGENAWLNGKTGLKEDVFTRIEFWNFPAILVITLKRFSQNGIHKRNDLVDFPIDNLDLSSFVRGYNSKSFVYELFGVCNHFGSVMGGHYTSFVKNASGEWLHCNDSNVSIIKDIRTIVSTHAYCLFYRKKNNFV
jgi:ubiquitin carboxyl-terminal hydrolase 8